eukprot:366229-Chlamydomonas_euryale.AAC.29
MLPCPRLSRLASVPGCLLPPWAPRPGAAAEYGRTEPRSACNLSCECITRPLYARCCCCCC